MIKIICFGKLKENYLINAVNDYFERINKYHKISILELKDSENIFDEEKELLKIIQNDKSYKILLDIKGEEVSSIEFSTTVPGVITRTISLFTRPFAVAGSSICSHMATL
mgnify:CR=1 FL=1